jgi:hypothetical protein
LATAHGPSSAGRVTEVRDHLAAGLEFRFDRDR